MLDRYKKLKAVQGLIQSLDEQIYRYDTVKKDEASQEVFGILIDKYYNAIINLLTNEPEKKLEDMNG